MRQKIFLKTQSQKFFEQNKICFFLRHYFTHKRPQYQTQEKGKLIFDLLAAVAAFKAKLKFFKSQVVQEIIAHFSFFLQRISQKRHKAAGVKYAPQIQLLIEEFSNRLTISSEEKLHLKIIENSFSIDGEEAPSHLQMEVIDLQVSSSLLQMFMKEMIKNLLILGKQTFSLFVGTYICEKTFSVMKLNKNNFSRLLIGI